MSARRPAVVASVLSRVAAAALGGYALATVGSVAFAAAVAGIGSMPRVDAALMAQQLSFVLYTGAVMWAFAARSARAAWVGLGLGLGLLAAALIAGAALWGFGAR